MANTVFMSALFNDVRFLTNSGVILNGGNVYSYLAGTNTPAVTYTDATGNTPNPDPITISSTGLLLNEVWQLQQQPMKYVVKDTSNVQIAVYDNVPGINDVSVPPSSFIFTTYLNTSAGGVISFNIPQTVAEGSAGVTPVNYQYAPGVVDRLL